jgi:hypothetical protein
VKVIIDMKLYNKTIPTKFNVNDNNTPPDWLTYIYNNDIHSNSLFNYNSHSNNHSTHYLLPWEKESCYMALEDSKLLAQGWNLLVITSKNIVCTIDSTKYTLCSILCHLHTYIY